LGSVPLGEAVKGPVRSAQPEDRGHFMAFCEIIPRREISLVQLAVIGFENVIGAGAEQVRPIFQEQFKQVPPALCQDRIEW
jgi:hypothetical protein